MKKMKHALILTAGVLLLGSGIAFAMNHGGGHSGHGSTADSKSAHDTHGGMGENTGHGSEHMGMSMTDGMEMIGSQTREGVKAMAHVTDMRKAMAEAGMPQTHHFMVAFERDAEGAPLTSGRVAVRVITPSGQTRSAIALQEMDGHFGADVELKEAGTYRFEVGTRIGDDQARQYEFEYDVK